MINKRAAKIGSFIFSRISATKSSIIKYRIIKEKIYEKEKIIYNA